MNKIVSVQLLRCIACLLVLQMHLIPHLFFLHRQYTGSIGVDLFFVISGFIISASIERLPSYKPATHFFINRLSRVWPYYVILTLITAVALYFSPYGLNIKQLIKSILFLPNRKDPIVFPAWTLNHEVLFYSFAGIMIAFKRNILTIGLLFLIFISIFHFLNFNNYNLMFLGASINFTFLFGMLGYLYRDNLIPVFRNWLVIAISVAVFFVMPFISREYPYEHLHEYLQQTNIYIKDTIFLINSHINMPRGLGWGLPSFMMFMTFYANEKRLLIFAGTLWEKIGDASYSMYLIQGVYLYFVFRSKYIHNNIICAMLFLLTVFLSLYAYRFENYIGLKFKKIFSKIFLRRIFETSQNV